MFPNLLESSTILRNIAIVSFVVFSCELNFTSSTINVTIILNHKFYVIIRQTIIIISSCSYFMGILWVVILITFIPLVSKSKPFNIGRNFAIPFNFFSHMVLYFLKKNSVITINISNILFSF